LAFEPMAFDDPLWVLYSSGTTGLPKPILHGHGGMLLEHAKQLALHLDLGPGDRFFWFSTTGWMMWNLLVSGLAVGSAIVLYDGNPAFPDQLTLWRLAPASPASAWAPLSSRPVRKLICARVMSSICRRCALLGRPVLRCSRKASPGSMTRSAAR
jgi:acyl-CoA synthetase (AMP-forming)/AMP-acid ligase II